MTMGTTRLLPICFRPSYGEMMVALVPSVMAHLSGEQSVEGTASSLSVLRPGKEGEEKEEAARRRTWNGEKSASMGLAPQQQQQHRLQDSLSSFPFGEACSPALSCAPSRTVSWVHPMQEEEKGSWATTVAIAGVGGGSAWPTRMCMAHEEDLMAVVADLLLQSSKYPPPPFSLPTRRSQAWWWNYRTWIAKREKVNEKNAKKKKRAPVMEREKMNEKEKEEADAEARRQVESWVLPLLSESLHYYLSQLGLPDGEATLRLVGFFPCLLQQDAYYWDRLPPVMEHTVGTPSEGTFLPSSTSTSALSKRETAEEKREKKKMEEIRGGGQGLAIPRCQLLHPRHRASDAGSARSGSSSSRTSSSSFSSTDMSVPALRRRYRRPRRRIRDFTPISTPSPSTYSRFSSASSREAAFAFTPDPPSPRSIKERKKRRRKRREEQRRSEKRRGIPSRLARSSSSSSSSMDSDSDTTSNSSTTSSTGEEDGRPQSRRPLPSHGKGRNRNRLFPSYLDRFKCYGPSPARRPSPSTRKRQGGSAVHPFSIRSSSPTPYPTGDLYSHGLSPRMLCHQQAPFLFPPSLPRVLLNGKANPFLHPLRSIPMCFLQIPSWNDWKDVTKEKEGIAFLQAVWRGQKRQKRALQEATSCASPTPTSGGPMLDASSSSSSSSAAAAAVPIVSSRARVIRFIRARPLTRGLHQQLLQAAMVYAKGISKKEEGKRHRQQREEEAEEEEENEAYASSTFSSMEASFSSCVWDRSRCGGGEGNTHAKSGKGIPSSERRRKEMQEKEKAEEQERGRWKQKEWTTAKSYYPITSSPGSVLSPAIMGGVAPCSIYLVVDLSPTPSPLSSTKEDLAAAGGAAPPPVPTPRYSVWGFTHYPTSVKKTISILLDHPVSSTHSSVHPLWAEVAGGSLLHAPPGLAIDAMEAKNTHAVDRSSSSGKEEPHATRPSRGRSRDSCHSSTSSLGSISIPFAASHTFYDVADDPMTTRAAIPTQGEDPPLPSSFAAPSPLPSSSSSSLLTSMMAHPSPLPTTTASTAPPLTLTRSQRWRKARCPFFIAHSMEDYFRLAAAFGWLYGWQLCYAPCGPPNTALAWLKWFNPAGVELARSQVVATMEELLEDEAEEEQKRWKEAQAEVERQQQKQVEEEEGGERRKAMRLRMTVEPKPSEKPILSGTQLAVAKKEWEAKANSSSRMEKHASSLSAKTIGEKKATQPTKKTVKK